MALKRRSVIAIGVFVLLAVVVAAGQWYETKRIQPGNTTEKDVTVHVTNAGDRGPGTLREALVAVAQGQKTQTAALAAYEREMIEQGFAAVNASLAEMRRLHARSAASRLLSKLVFRTVDTVKPLQKLFRGKR